MRWRPTCEQGWWLFALPLLLAAVGVWSSGRTKLSWALLGAAALAVGSKVLPLLISRARRRDQRDALVIGSTRTRHRRGRLEKVRDVDPRHMGVHRAHVEMTYVHRDAEAPLRDLLTAGKPVLVLGHSMAGKTHMSAQVLREHFGKRRLLVPTSPRGLAELMANGFQPKNAVLWLDDLDRYLVDEGIRVEWVDRIVAAGGLVVATMRASAHTQYQPTGPLRAPHVELLERFEIVRLRPDDDEERRRLAQQVADPSLREGIIKYGLAEYVGAGYLAVQRFENAAAAPTPAGHPLGVAMVRAAVDWRRVGLDVIPATSLAALAPMYLSQRHRYEPGEDTATALAWASELIDSTVRLLEHDDDGGVRAFDYIVDYLSTDDPGSGRTPATIPEHTWGEAAAAAPFGLSLRFAHAAERHGELDYAERTWRQVVASAHPDFAPLAAVSLGMALTDQDRLEDADMAFRQAATSTDPGLATFAEIGHAVVLRRQDCPAEAEAAYRQAATSTDLDMAARAALGLVGLLLAAQRPGEAETALHQAATSTAPDVVAQTAMWFGLLRRRQGRLDEAETAYRRAVISGDPDVAAMAVKELADLAHEEKPDEEVSVE